jgi:uncharacterized membrane protein YdfJ with MMPL/SSD domain
MKLEQLQSAYTQFFLKSAEGKYFMAQLTMLIDSAHEKAEKDPTFARDLTQEARGVREVQNHIKSVIS